uniref:Uncharacterized protein n=1 Tax=Oryza brachyantha TaxID=4533 RepID=J3MEK0_ORYBR
MSCEEAAVERAEVVVGGGDRASCSGRHRRVRCGGGGGVGQWGEVAPMAASCSPFAFLGALGPGRPSASLLLPEAADDPEPPVGPPKLRTPRRCRRPLTSSASRSASPRTCSTSCSNSLLVPNRESLM